jgi:hypothetical protein
MENTKVIKSKKSIKFIIKDETIKMPIEKKSKSKRK